MSNDLAPKPLDGEILPPLATMERPALTWISKEELVRRSSGQEMKTVSPQAEPTIANGGLKITVDILAAMTEGCQEEVNYFKNWNQKWRQHKTGDRAEGPCLPKA